MDLNEFINQVLRVIGDHFNDIKVLGCVMLLRLAQVAPTAMAQRLDEAVPELKKAMAANNEIDLQRHCRRAIAGLGKIRASGNAPAFDAWVQSAQLSVCLSHTWPSS